MCKKTNEKKMEYYIAYSFSLDGNVWRHKKVPSWRWEDIKDKLPKPVCRYYACLYNQEYDCYDQPAYCPIVYVSRDIVSLKELPKTPAMEVWLKMHCEWKNYKKFYLCGNYCFPVTLAKKKKMIFNSISMPEKKSS